MSQQEEDPSHSTRLLVVKPALSQLYDQLLPSLEPGPTLVDMVTTGFGPGGQ